MIPADPTTAWLSLIPYSEPGDVREWLGEWGAHGCWQRGVRDLTDREGWPVVAEVLAQLLGHPNEVIEGMALS